MNNKKNPAEKKYTIGIVGVRGYVGKELLSLIKGHPLLELAWVSSRQLKGQTINSIVDGFDDLVVEDLSPEQVANKQTSIVVLALPNGLAAPYVNALEACQKSGVLIDLSADYRFDEDWYYSVPELDNIKQGKISLSSPIKISNPGCYATAMLLALAPIKDLVSGRPNCFGISGYSGAGTKASPNNDVERLSKNICGYALIEHLHEKEVSIKLDKPVSFSPHVAEFFRGINMTIQVEFEKRITARELFNRFNDFYAMHPLVVCKEEIPTLKESINSPLSVIGGFSVSKDGMRGTIISCLDNLLKGAASQALQNINLALGENSTLGLIENNELNPLIAANERLISKSSIEQLSANQLTQ
ncbi:N-acetyl-gamma-glutamyl-phosphate reductase [Aliikangiella coralliicola]|uniref:N-acetyl-gamma-glutamyl-phosphate reductase n=1 Tax=Aliikangiella coralliicola TaxID=2592383 RepID=A0A545UA71_9GAMM|nr:N-acetyl-gamma-glutamyl-phosphate reductase [Aliikangiella coralliicola]TQV86374.1 N-acetyl-gamma-glutamyl-phosphate reductase [Aliikangiella coralliicola]